jgi:hypothetical protein
MNNFLLFLPRQIIDASPAPNQQCDRLNFSKSRKVKSIAFNIQFGCNYEHIELFAMLLFPEF